MTKTRMVLAMLAVLLGVLMGVANAPDAQLQLRARRNDERWTFATGAHAELGYHRTPDLQKLSSNAGSGRF